MADPPVHERTLKVRGHAYLQRYRYVYDTRSRRYRFELLESRPLHPIYRRPPAMATPPLETYPCTLVQFGLLATHVMNRTLTAEIARDLIEGMGEVVPPGTLHALGIRFDLGEKTQPEFEFLLWRSPPSSSPDSAPSARRRSRSSTGAPRRRSSPSAGGSG